MLPGPMLIKRCDACDGLFKQRTLTSGNTCGATYWTDGKMGAPMLPRTPLLIRCPHCSSILWTKSLREVDSYPTYRGFLIFEDDEAVGNSKRAAIERKEKAYESLPFFALATFEDLNAFADGAGLSSEEELIVRRQAWLTGNDSRRHSDSPSPLTSGEEANLERLLVLQADLVDPAVAVAKAEALRELGRFDEALAILDSSELGNDENYSAVFIRELIASGDAQVCALTRPEDREWRAKRRRERKMALNNPITLELDPTGPPSFEIRSGEWWFKVIGMCCHNWALLEDRGSAGVTAYFFHDVGVSQYPVPGYSTHQIKGRSAVVDSLDFPSSYEALDELQMNGFKLLEPHPGPWDSMVPQAPFFDARASEEGLYSKGGNWVSTQSLIAEYEESMTAESTDPTMQG